MSADSWHAGCADADEAALTDWDERLSWDAVDVDVDSRFGFGSDEPFDPGESERALQAWADMLVASKSAQRGRHPAGTPRGGQFAATTRRENRL